MSLRSRGRKNLPLQAPSTSSYQTAFSPSVLLPSVAAMVQAVPPHHLAQAALTTPYTHTVAMVLLVAASVAQMVAATVVMAPTSGQPQRCAVVVAVAQQAIQVTADMPRLIHGGLTVLMAGAVAALEFMGKGLLALLLVLLLCPAMRLLVQVVVAVVVSMALKLAVAGKEALEVRTEHNLPPLWRRMVAGKLELLATLLRVPYAEVVVAVA
jgi:hypothetical protein